MNKTALGAENKKKQTINFLSEAHEKFYYEKLKVFIWQLQVSLRCGRNVGGGQQRTVVDHG